MDDSTRKLHNKVLNCINRFKQNIDAIFTAKSSNDIAILPALFARNKGLLIDLRKAERDLKISIEFKRSQNLSEQELTNSMMDQLRALEYEKNALENEIKDYKEKEDKELAKLGYEIKINREEIIEKITEEFETIRKSPNGDLLYVNKNSSFEVENSEDEATVSSTVQTLDEMIDTIFRDENPDNGEETTEEEELTR
ncbi:unnamed protein product [Blepharisma stoltei]|uniref:Uncharacterized protein n=1 Tax=Blepharisma stoltei TaxID=1481888 RepID=A0AAU9JZF4_9CILI|nr:unnamed protein product [Blepharisma stoltei]